MNACANVYPTNKRQQTENTVKSTSRLFLTLCAKIAVPIPVVRTISIPRPNGKNGNGGRDPIKVWVRKYMNK